MSQRQWTYLSGDEKTYHFGLYHGADSGHLLLHCNQDPVIIDFSVLSDKQYHFYVNHEILCLRLSRSTEGFNYELTRDDEVITPYNVALKQQNKRYNAYAWALAISILVLVISLIFIYS